jgi:Tripartite tricarboxylate transporter TctB family
METNESSATPRAVAANYVVEAAVALLIIAFGAMVLIGSWKLGSGWTSDGPGPGYFPFYIGIILCVSGAGTFVKALFSKERDTGTFVDREQLTRVIQVFVPALVFVLFIQFLGIYIASALYIALFMVVLGKYSWLKSAVIAVTLNVVFFFMFEVWFKVPLYKGTFEPLGFLGY